MTRSGRLHPPPVKAEGCEGGGVGVGDGGGDGVGGGGGEGVAKAGVAPVVRRVQPRATVPCNGCTACCQDDLILLLPEHGDRPEDYDAHTIIHPLSGHPVMALKHVDGHCVHLGPDGCTIWDRAPAICRAFDCARLYASMPRAERRRRLKIGLLTPEVMDAGRRVMLERARLDADDSAS